MRHWSQEPDEVIVELPRIEQRHHEPNPDQKMQLKKTQKANAFNHIREATPKEDESEMEPVDAREEPMIETNVSERGHAVSP